MAPEISLLRWIRETHTGVSALINKNFDRSFTTRASRYRSAYRFPAFSRSLPALHPGQNEDKLPKGTRYDVDSQKEPIYLSFFYYSTFDHLLLYEELQYQISGHFD